MCGNMKIMNSESIDRYFSVRIFKNMISENKTKNTIYSILLCKSEI